MIETDGRIFCPDCSMRSEGDAISWAFRFWWSIMPRSNCFT